VVADRLTRKFRDVTAISDLSFEVAPAELFGIVGPDGAGKTTLLRMLAGVLRPSAGDAHVGGASVARQAERVKRGIAYMSQRFGLYTDLTVLENITFYADLYLVPRADLPGRLEELFGFSGLGPFQERLAGALSGGMKQKLGLCCALIHRPPLLLLDEPTFGVDPVSRRDLWLIVHGLVGGGTTVVVSTSYLDEAERCDRVLLLDRGRRVALDRPGVLQSALAGRTYRVVAPDPGRAVAILRDLAGVRVAARYGGEVRVMVGDPTVVPTLGPALATLGGPIRIDPAAPSMEDVFIAQAAGALGG
jgi:ABC-2 type transport system ATP-binding protein